jgi:hypothetical protein
MLVTGNPQNHTGFPEFFWLHNLYRQCPCQGLGQKGTGINHMKRNENHGLRGNITTSLPGLPCQDFLQTVKPVGEGFNQNNPEGFRR